MTSVIPSLANNLPDKAPVDNMSAKTEPIVVRNEQDFKPLVDIKEPNLLNLVKFSHIDTQKRQAEWQKAYGITPSIPKESAVSSQQIKETFTQKSTSPLLENNVQNDQSTKKQASPWTPAMLAMTPLAPLTPKNSNKPNPSKQPTTNNLSRNLPEQAPPSPKLLAHNQPRLRRGKKRNRLVLSLFVLSLVLFLLSVGFVIWKRQQKPQEMNFKLRLQKYEQSIIAAARQTGVWPSVTAAQLYIEAGDGPNKLADIDNNGFGLKWHDNMARRHRNKAWPVTYETKEYLDGKMVTMDDLFGKFANFEIGLFEHDRIWWNGYHEEARQVLMDLENGTRENFIDAILHYATAPEYRAAISKVIKEQKLDYLDDLAFPNGKRLQAGFPDLQKRANETALQDAVKKLQEEQATKEKQNNKEKPTSTDNPEQELTVENLSDEQKSAALKEVDKKMFHTLGAYPNDGYNISDLKNENLQVALKR